MMGRKHRLILAVLAFLCVGPILAAGAPNAFAQPACTNGDCPPPPPDCTNGDCPQVPEPATWLLLASGLLGWIGTSAWINRGRRRAEAAAQRRT